MLMLTISFVSRDSQYQGQISFIIKMMQYQMQSLTHISNLKQNSSLPSVLFALHQLPTQMVLPVGKLPLLSEHFSERLRNVSKPYPHKKNMHNCIFRQIYFTLKYNLNAISLHNLAVVSAHQMIEWTYEEFNSRVDSIAIGLKKGDRVGIYSPNKAEWTLLQFAPARVDLILVDVNPAFEESELRYCFQKVGINTLVMAEKFKSFYYIKIFRAIVPQVKDSTIPLDLRHIPDFPMLKNVVLIGDTDARGMLNFKDLYNIHTEKDAMELIEREKVINFEDATNIQFTSSHALPLQHSEKWPVQCRSHGSNRQRQTLCLRAHHCLGLVIGNLSALNFAASMVYGKPSTLMLPLKLQ